MASIINRKGLTEIQFISPDKKQRVVRLGKIGSAAAAEIKAHIEHLVECWRYAGERPVNRGPERGGAAEIAAIRERLPCIRAVRGAAV
jgi:hypothetical protein